MKKFFCVLLICLTSVACFAKDKKSDVKEAFKDLGNSLMGVLEEAGGAFKEFYVEMKPLFDEVSDNFKDEVMPLVNKKIKELKKMYKKAEKEDLPKIQKQLQAMIDRLNEIYEEEDDKKTKDEIDESLEELDKLNKKVLKKI